MKSIVTNPILKGFNPDPSIVKIPEGYLIAVSTFEWMPGIRVYFSKDLVQWQLETSILTTQVDLQGNPQNGSIWAPQLSYHNGKFYCVYTNVKSTTVPFKDCHNYVITAPTIHGPWSEPIYLNSSGFDPSIFHDANGTKWLLNELWDYRMPMTNKSSGIVLQELHPETLQLIGPRYKIFDGTTLQKTEAPHLYHRGDYYYLVTAEGGTGRQHSVTIARSPFLTGPYEVSPYPSLLTARDKKESTLQCSGHASFVKTDADEWYMVYLATRPMRGGTPLGRETCIQPFTWSKEGWPIPFGKTNGPMKQVEITTKSLIVQKEEISFTDYFSSEQLHQEWSTLRQLPGEWAHVDSKKQQLVLKSGESTRSLFRQHMVAYRQQHFHYQVQVTVDFYPKSFNEMAGILCYLHQDCHFYTYVTHDEAFTTVIRCYEIKNGVFRLLPVMIPIKEGPITFQLENNYGQLTVSYREQEGEWQFVTKHDVSFLTGGFTGNMIALACQNLDTYEGSVATYTNFSYHGVY